MKLIFFQNCVSPHQVPYMKVLAQRHDVTLVAPCFTPDDRAALGWTDKDSAADGIRLMIAPTDDQVTALFEQKQSEERAVCLFSSITGFKEVKHWLDMSLQYDVRRGVICEAPITYKWPLWMHKIHFVLCDLKYRKHLQYVFAIGEDCADYYRGWGSQWRVVDFAYCVDYLEMDMAAVEEQRKENAKTFDMCYVGSLIKRKNVKVLLEALVKLREKHPDAFRLLHLTVVGDGEEREALENFVDNENLEEHVHFKGALPMKEVRQLIASHDVLVLPSLYDGWGAVVNEALMVGTQVWCSENCGAKGLLDEGRALGKVFDPKDSYSLMKLIWNDHGFFRMTEKAAARRAKIMAWAQETISPEAIASIMEDAVQLYSE